MRLVTRDGATVTGRLLNQDAFTVQLLDSKEQLRTMQRADLKEFAFIDKSPMPPYKGKLSPQEITDLVSYLVSLQGGGNSDWFQFPFRFFVPCSWFVFVASWLCRSRLRIMVASLQAQGQVTFDRLVRASQEPQNWLTYSGSYFSQRYTELAQITPENVRNLEPAWIFQLTSREPTSTRFEVTPVVVDGVMYIVQPPNDIVALDAVTGRPYLDLLVQSVASVAAVLRPGESRRRDSTGPSVHGHDRRPSGRGRCEDRKVALG